MSFYYLLQPATGSSTAVSAEYYQSLWNGGTLLSAGCDQTLTIGSWSQVACEVRDSDATELGLTFRVFSATWKGTIYIDNVQIR